MTISSTTVRNSYSGDGSTTTFTYTFKIFQDSDIQVIIRAANGTETIKTITTHYTVTGAGVSTGGTVVFTSGNIPTNTQTVVLRRNIPQTQAIDYMSLTKGMNNDERYNNHPPLVKRINYAEEVFKTYAITSGGVS